MDRIKLFESKKVRTHWDEENETWYFSVIDVIETLTGSRIPKRYWSDLKKEADHRGN
jgi:DNA-damage-inducible protein D